MTTQEMISATIRGLKEEDAKLQKSTAKVAEYVEKIASCRNMKDYFKYMKLEAKWRMERRQAELHIEVRAERLLSLITQG